MRAETVSLLRAPNSGEALRLVTEPGVDGVSRQILISEPSGKRFDLREGIPVLLDKSAIAPLDRHYQTLYDRVASLYDPSVRVLATLLGGERRFREGLLQRIGLQPGQRVLEVSAGTGANLRYLPAGISAYALDLSWGMLRRCQRNLRRWGLGVEQLQADATALPFADQTFDAVYQVGALNGISDRRLALAEMVRVTRPGGRLLVADETERASHAFAWVPGARKMAHGYGERFQPPVDLLPESMKDVQVSSSLQGWFYCLTFARS